MTSPEVAARSLTETLRNTRPIDSGRELHGPHRDRAIVAKKLTIFAKPVNLARPRYIYPA